MVCGDKERPRCSDQYKVSIPKCVISYIITSFGHNEQKRFTRLSLLNQFEGKLSRSSVERTQCKLTVTYGEHMPRTSVVCINKLDKELIRNDLIVKAE